MGKFIESLMKRDKILKKLKRKEVMIFNVNGSYGVYQVKIGPEDTIDHSRSIEINGQIHHLFLSKKRIEPLPAKEDINNNMRGTVIMRDITVHLFDKNGEGHKVKIERSEIDGVHAKNQINLAGQDGEKMLNEIEATGKLADEAYQIIQKDILKSVG
jgi:hypothetical protein